MLRSSWMLAGEGTSKARFRGCLQRGGAVRPRRLAGKVADCRQRSMPVLDLIDLFPKTVAVAQLQTLSPALIARAIDYLEVASSTDLGADGAYTTEQQLLDKAMFRELREEILQRCLEFAQAYSHDVTELMICNSWGNIVGHQQSIRYHRHDNSYISGSLYLSEGSPFNILNPHQGGLFGLMPRVRRED